MFTNYGFNIIQVRWDSDLACMGALSVCYLAASAYISGLMFNSFERVSYSWFFKPACFTRLKRSINYLSDDQ
jgi:hypothetical protein